VARKRGEAYRRRKEQAGLNGLLCREPTRLDQAIEVTAVEQQPTNGGQCDTRERSALDEVADGPDADTQVVGSSLDVQQPGGVDWPTGSPNQRNGCTVA
jgi:hypothetical protein